MNLARLPFCATRVSETILRKLNHGEYELIPTIDHWIGQDAAIRRFKVALEASWHIGAKLPHMIFCGSPGTGKTLLANLAAKEMGVQLHERIAQSSIGDGSSLLEAFGAIWCGLSESCGSSQRASTNADSAQGVEYLGSSKNLAGN